MSYCSVEDLLIMLPESELAALTTESGDQPDEGIVAEAIAKGDAEIDSCLGSRYTVPLAPVPAQIKALSVELAIYHLYSRRGVMPPVRREKYAAAVACLNQLATGEAVLAGTPELSPEAPEISAATRQCSRETLGEW